MKKIAPLLFVLLAWVATAVAQNVGGGIDNQPTSLPPSGAAGGDLGGTYPNPTVLSVADVTTGTLGAANGGTGLATYAVGDIIYASGATAFSRLADVATGNVLLSGGVGAAPAWGKVALSALATQATNTITGNATNGSAAPTALAIGSCSTAASALNWTTNTGFGCNTSITAAAVPASGLTGTVLASNVVTSSLTSAAGGTFGTAAYVNTGTSAGTVPLLNGANTWSGAQTHSALVTLTSLAETYTAPAISAGTLTIDLSTGTVFNVSSNANITTFTISNATASKASSFTLILTANGTGYTQTWGSSVVWPAGVTPVLTTTNNKRDVLTFVTNDGGTTWFGFVGGQNY